MLLLENLFLVLTIPLASLYSSTISIFGFALLILLSGVLLSVEILGGLYQLTFYQQSVLFILIIRSILLLLPEGKVINTKLLINILFSIFIIFINLLLADIFLESLDFDCLLTVAPVIVYSNAETDKSQILKDNKGKTGIYLWTHITSGQTYVGSAKNLTKRMYYYFSASELKRTNYYISRAILRHTHSAFTLSILEYIDITNLSLEEARKLILSREQY